MLPTQRCRYIKLDHNRIRSFRRHRDKNHCTYYLQTGERCDEEEMAPLISLGDFGRAAAPRDGMEGGVTNFVNLISAIAADDVVVAADNNLKRCCSRFDIHVLGSEQSEAIKNRFRIRELPSTAQSNFNIGMTSLSTGCRGDRIDHFR